MKVLVLSLLACKGEAPSADTGPPQDTADTAPACTEPTLWWPDLDGDGYGASRDAVSACEAPSGTSALAGDCDDADWSVNPGATERCDGVDNDCDGGIDLGAADADDWYQDVDGDGYGSGAALSACTSPFPSGTLSDGDCDDGDPAIHPGAPETDCTDPVDYNCDGSVGYGDDDGDGVPACMDCDDTNAQVHPSRAEVCDDIDNDCDGVIDGSAVDALTLYADIDGDGYGDSGMSQQACEPSDGWVLNASDCDDSQSSINPSASEVCDGATDEDCDGEIDEPSAADAPTWNIDVDGDGYGVSTITTVQCTQPSGFVSDDSDCDDSDASVHPSADELCGGDDEDCDGSVDESGAIDASTWYADSDGDGYGDASSSTVACTVSSGWVSDTTDCDDSDDSVNPGADEVCDGQDNDCDGDSDHGAVWVGTDYSSIQDAIDDADDGDLICIAAGTWSENLDFGGKSCTLEGDARGLTAIDGSASGIVVQATQGEEIGLRSLTLQNGANATGAGLYLVGAAATLRDVAFEDMDCSGWSTCTGGALYSSASDIDAEGVQFSDVDAQSTTAEGAVIHLSESTAGFKELSVESVDCGTSTCQGVLAWASESDVLLSGVQASGLRGSVSTLVEGGLFYGEETDLQAGDVEVSDSSFSGDGTGIFHNEYGTLDLADIRIHDNTWDPVSDFDGMVAYDQIQAGSGSQPLQVDGLWVQDNQVAFSGGQGDAQGGLGIYAFGGWSSVESARWLELYNAVWSGNTLDDVSENDGAVLHVDAGLRVDIEHLILAGNELSAGSGSTENLGWLQCDSDGVLHIDNADVAYNSADSFGTLYGGLLTAGDDCEVEISNSSFVGNDSAGSTAYSPLFYCEYPATYHKTCTLSWQYNNAYDNSPSGDSLVWWGGTATTPDSTNLATSPGYADTSSSDPSDWDLSLDSGSSLIDAGDPSLVDDDGSARDIGAYGGLDVDL